MNNKLIIPLGDFRIVAELNDVNSPGSNDFPIELCVMLEDSQGRFIQDICIARQHYEFDHTNDTFHKTDSIDLFTWGDSSYEDYTQKYIIPVRKFD